MAAPQRKLESRHRRDCGLAGKSEQPERIGNRRDVKREMFKKRVHILNMLLRKTYGNALLGNWLNCIS
jgi:hypothetical protein